MIDITNYGIILLTSDRDGKQDMLKMLRSAGIENSLLLFDSESELLKTPQEKTGLIIIDVGNEDSLIIVRKLHELSQFDNIPKVIFLSQDHNQEDLLELMTVGAVDFIFKPVQTIEFAARVLHNLAGYALYQYNMINQIELATHEHDLEEAYLVLSEINLESNLQKEELEQLNKAKDRINSIISHDLRGPVANIKSIVELLKVHFDKLEQGKKLDFLNTLENLSNGTLDLLENLLAWSRAQTGQIKPNWADVNLSKIIEAKTHMYKQMAISKQISFLQEIPADLHLITDSEILNIILQNLITNAIKFTHKKGKVCLEIKKIEEDDSVQFKVSDNGIGMSPDVVKKVFEHNFNVTTYGTNNEKGTGLGLKIVGDFIKLLKGSIKISSREGKGSSFVFKLPIVNS